MANGHVQPLPITHVQHTTAHSLPTWTMATPGNQLWQYPGQYRHFVVLSAN